MAKYQFSAKVWKYKGPAGWHFVTLPKTLSKKIRHAHGLSEEGWGRLKAEAKIGKAKWATAIWYDTRLGSYLLPIKAAVRRSEKIEVDSRVAISLSLRPEDPLLKRFLRS